MSCSGPTTTPIPARGQWGGPGAGAHEWVGRGRSACGVLGRQEGVSGPRVVQAFIFTRYPPPGRRIRTATSPSVHLYSLSAAKKAHPDPEWSRRLSSLAIRRQEGVSWPRVVQPFLFTRYPLPGPRAVQAFMLTRYPLPGRRIRTPCGPAVHLRSQSAARKAYRDPEWSSRSSSLAVRRQEGVYGPEGPTVFLNSPKRCSDDAFGSLMVQSFSSPRLSATR